MYRYIKNIFVIFLFVLLLFLGREVSAKDSSFVSWTVKWGELNIPYEGYWTNVYELADPEKETKLTTFFKYVFTPTTYTYLLTPELQTHTYSYDYATHAVSGFRVEWEDGKFSTNWSGSSFCLPGPEVTAHLYPDYIEIKNPSLDDWSVEVDGKTRLLKAGKNMRIVLNADKSINIYNESGYFCSTAFWEEIK